jgi:PST family polysaccharide transporter
MVLLGVVLFFTANIWPSLLGPEYEGTATLFRIMSFIPLFVSLGGIQGQLGLLAIGHDKEKKYFRNVYIIAGLLAVCGIFAVSPILTASNAAWVLFATEFWVAVGMIHYCRKL